MKYVYPVLIKNEDGKFLVSVPDLSGCHTFGDSFCEAIEMTRDAMAMWLCIAEDRNENIPKPTMNYKSDNGTVSYIDVDTIAYRRATDSKAIKKTLSVPSWLNTQAELAGINFSSVLQSALMEQLHIPNDRV